MNSKQHGGNAFARSASLEKDRMTGEIESVVDSQDGMLLIDYFAAKILQSLVLNPLPNSTFANDCNYAYALADEMIRARRRWFRKE